MADTLQDAGAGTAIPGDGWVWIGRDAEPGLYQSSDEDGRCTWTRAKDATSEPDSITAVGSSQGRAYARLEAGDFFHSDGCGTWHRFGGEDT